MFHFDILRNDILHWMETLRIPHNCNPLRPSTTVSSQDVTVMSNVLAIMVTGFAIGVPQMVTDKMLSGTNKHWFVAIASLTASLIGLSVGLFLMTKTHLGLYGMALGWASVYFIRGVLVFPISACRHFKIGFFAYIAETYLTPLAAASILMATAYLVRRFFDISSLGPLLCAGAFCVAVYAVAVYLICFQPDQRKRIWSMIT